MKKNLIILFSLLIISQTFSISEGNTSLIDSRLSGIVALVMDRPDTHEWLENPGLSFNEAYIRFPENLGDDVIFGIDQEFIDGIFNPQYYPGGDWMALAGLQRNGTVWVATGTQKTMKGNPSKQRVWKIFQLDTPLKPDTWYRLSSVADFKTRKFVSFTIEGPGISKTFDLSAYFMDYPNKIPFNHRVMTYYVWSMRGKSLAKDLKASSIVYFDSVRAGFIDSNNTKQTVFQDGFELDQTTFSKQPLEFKNNYIPVENYHDSIWYLERDESRCKPCKVDFAQNGSHVAICDAILEKIDYQSWVIRDF